MATTQDRFEFPYRFEGTPYQAPNGTVYDSRAAHIITMWSMAHAFYGTQRHSYWDLYYELLESQVYYIRLEGSGNLVRQVGRAIRFEDGSMVAVLMKAGLSEDGYVNMDGANYIVYRLINPTEPGETHYVNFGYDPPIVSCERPLEGHFQPPKVSHRMH